jgi:hypothetical protein
MRKTLMFVLVFLFISSFVYAELFAPVLLEFTAPDQVGWQGGALDFDITVTGTSATVMFMVFTKDQGANISAVRNGYLGWHYVNGIDTCLFVQNFDFTTGVNTISWTGNDADGNAVPMDETTEYTYYLYGYDHVNAKQLAVPLGCGWENASMWREFDNEGNALDQPELYPSIWSGGGDIGDITRTKWIMGWDTSDASQAETTVYQGYHEHSPYIPHPYEMDGFFNFSIDGTPTAHVKKYQWVPNGAAILDDAWGDAGGEVTFSIVTTPTGEWPKYVGGIDIGSDLIMCSSTDLSGVSTESILKLIDVPDGYVYDQIDLTDWWIRMDDGGDMGQQSSGPNDFDFRNGMLVMGSHSTCMNQMIDPLADPTDELAWNKWVNQNGDITGDHNFEETAEFPWLCHDYVVGPYKYNTDTDALNFVTFPSYGCGAVTFGLYAPDGTGLGYYAAAGEHDGAKWMAKMLDNGSAYDGLYTDGVNVGNAQFYFIANESFMGSLVYSVSVEEDAPAQFAVSQNSPNPFNPTTTINFEIAKAGNVTIDVYNVAGQKVDTIVDEYMEDGPHSKVWDATGFSAGVYFYTVKSGNFSKTMSMTLLK